MRRFLAAPLPAVAILAIAGAFATGAYALGSARGTIHGCESKRSHVLYVAKRCKRHDTALVWNKTGPQGAKGASGAQGVTGAPGQSVTSSPLTTGNANCPNGGSSFLSASGTTYACNGANGATHVTVRVATASEANGTYTTVASCHAGEVATGGGADLDSGSASMTYWFEPGGVPATGSSPAGNGASPDGWLATWVNNSGSTEEVDVYVVCASP